MHARLTPLLALLMASAAIAGCADSSPKPSPEQDANFEDLGLQATETTGILRGVVVDEAVRPVPEVVVAILGGEDARNTTTREDGAFGFDGLAPGTYFLTATKPGYGVQQTSADVVAGEAEPALVKILLLADPSSGPRIQAEHLDGFIQCSVRPMFLGLQCGATSQDIVNANYQMGAPPDHIQSEMIWKSTQAFGDELSLAIRCLPGSLDPAGRCPQGQLTIARSEGKSPQIARINSTLVQNWTLGGPEGNPLSISLFAFGRSDLDMYNESTVDNAQRPVTGKPCLDWMGTLFPAGTCIRMTGPGFIINQKVDVYTHMFYGFTPDEKWTFINNGPHPLPAAR